MTRMKMCLWIAGNTDTDTDTDLRVHERLHTDEKLFKCHHCDKIFVQNDNLRVHERIHIREKPFKCHHCDKTFVHNDDLRVHERLHTGEKPFKCHHCDEKFDQKDKLREHAKIHTGKKTPQTSRVRLGMAGPVVRTPAKRQKRSKGTKQSPKPSTSQQQDRPVWNVSPSASPPRDKSP